MLVRRGGRSGETDERHWFLFKERDEFARPGESITAEMPLSVTTGRNLEEIAAQSDRVWGPAGELPRKTRQKTKEPAPKAMSRRQSRKGIQVSNSDVASRRHAIKKAAQSNGRRNPRPNESRLQKLLEHPSVKRAKLPATQMVELATLVKEAPPGDDWLHEIKFDGYRMLCRVDNGKVRFISRNGHDWTKKFPELAAAASELPVEQAMLDGEVVAVQPDGTTSFQSLQNIFEAGRTRELVYYAFDILYLDGHDVTGVPLEQRKKILREVCSGRPHESIRYSDHLQGTGPELISHACRLHLEGIISKRRGSPYRPGRGLDWLKVKCSQREEFVVGGFTKPSGGRTHFGALLVGYYDSSNKLIYAGRVGTGFNVKTLASLRQRLITLAQPESPFSNLSSNTGQARGVSWVKPVLVAELAFSNWTDERLLRHPSFQGLREDKPAIEVVHDEPISPGEAKAMEDGRKTGTQGDSRKRKALPGHRPGKPTVHPAGDDEIAGVRLSHPDKVLFPEQGITKRDLANYYAEVADWMLPHVVDRPMALVRCPSGSGKPCFFQKHPGEGASTHLRQVNISEKGAPEYHLTIDDLSGLISLVQLGVLEIHVWGSHARHLEKPDRLIFDLDPDPAVDWPHVIVAAREVRLVLEELGLKSFLKTTGGKGLHLVVPIQPRTEWDEAKAFCRAVADFIVRAAPDRYIATISKAARKGKIFIDYLRNGRGATSIAPYSTRSRAEATVSVPITWEELSPRLRSDQYTVQNLPARLRNLKQDPWADIATTRQSITVAMRKRLEALKSPR
jgi:bifunctional non-homologous end joining protein LigD